MGKKAIGPVPYVYPVPIVLVGALVDGRANYATVGDCAIMGIKPAVVVVSLGESHHTTRGILEHRTFSINIPHTGDLRLVDYFGQVSGRDVDKSKLVRSFSGRTKTAPMIESCPVSLECRVLSEVSVEHRRIFIGAVEEAHVDEAYIGEDGRIAPLPQLSPILYALDNRYYRVGEAIGTGYEEGKSFAG
jgi:flavin reductase (DIM6/NTAB) family NADH-FMN oxidoreductase RutF